MPRRCSRCRLTKNDRNDAIGIARIMQTGWFKEVHVKDIDSHSVRALLAFFLNAP
jgi:transposase